MNSILRRILFALLLFSLLSSCASASPYVNLTEACRDIRAAVYGGQTHIEFSLTKTAVSNRRQAEIRDILTDVLEGYVDYTIAFEQIEDDLCVTIDGTIRPVLSLLLAWETGERTFLTDDESRCLDMALDIANDCRKGAQSALEIERAVYDAVCRYVVYSTLEELPPFGSKAYIRLNSCIGALLDGETTCMGYSEAFYLIGRLAGLDVQMQYGFPGGGVGGKHAWNTVRIGTKTYTVDACWGDTRGDLFEPTAPNYTCFNTALDLMPEGRHAHPEAEICEISSVTDWAHTAFGAANGGITANTLNEAIDYAIARHGENQPYAHIVIPDQAIALDAVDSAMWARVRAENILTTWGRMTYSFAGGTYIIFRWVL